MLILMIVSVVFVWVNVPKTGLVVLMVKHRNTTMWLVSRYQVDQRTRGKWPFRLACDKGTENRPEAEGDWQVWLLI